VPYPWWWWLLAAIAALLIGWFIWWWRRRRRGAAEAPRDPYAEATAGFQRVERLRLIESGEPGRHAALMADVVRRYLADRIDGASLAHTSGELLAAVRGAPTVSYDALDRLFADVDPVKFANGPISDERALAVGGAAKQIVKDEHERAAAIATAAAQTERAA
jgi:hypothetical protein